MNRAVFCKTWMLIFLCLLLGPAAVWAQSAKRSRPSTRPTPSPAFVQLTKKAEAARQAEQYEEAIKLYQQAVRQNTKWSEGWWSLGTLYYQLDRYAEGREAFRRLVALEPKGGVGWAFLGLCEYQLKAYENALKYLQIGRDLGLGGNPEIIVVCQYHAAILMNRFEQFELAQSVLQELAKLQGETPAVFEAFGLALLRLAHLPGEIPANKREAVVKAGRAGFYMAVDRRPEAQQEFKELITAFPAEPNVHYAYGVFFLRDSPDEAIAEFKRELELTPAHIYARLQIAFEYLKRNQAAPALPFAEEAVKLAPELFATHNALGRVVLELGQTERAIKELEIGVKQAPTSPEMYFALARAYSKAGRKDDADRARAEFVRLDKIRRSKKESFVEEQSRPER